VAAGVDTGRTGGGGGAGAAQLPSSAALAMKIQRMARVWHR